MKNERNHILNIAYKTMELIGFIFSIHIVTSTLDIVSVERIEETDTGLFNSFSSFLVNILGPLSIIFLYIRIYLQKTSINNQLNKIIADSKLKSFKPSIQLLKVKTQKNPLKFKIEDNIKITTKELEVRFQKHLLSHGKGDEYKKQRKTQDKINFIMEFAKNNQLMLIIDRNIENEITSSITNILEEENHNLISYCKTLINTYIGQDNFFWILIAICNKNQYFEKN
ncbi:hypothetical protein [Xenorhabdus bharatensis]|uniref:hypothetical protein n=1 Tax=Xenorhabdus bharatensis TaxID=3136256 RepID=UPI0030F37FDB